MTEYNSYFDELIDRNEELSQFKSDVGVRLISENMEYKIDETKRRVIEAIEELYNPKKRESFLAYLMYKIGYFRFKEPIVINATITSGNETTLNKGVRFTDSIDVYTLKELVSVPANTPTTIKLWNAMEYVSNHTVSGVRYFKISTNALYEQISSITIERDGIKLKYSQLFLEYGSDVSYEIREDGKIDVVILIGNKDGMNIKQGDTLTMKVDVSPETDTIPDNLGIVESGYNIAVTNIAIASPYIPPLSLEEMRDMIKYGRENMGDMVMNEDYYQFIKANVDGIRLLKVWQEREEVKEVGYDTAIINRVYVSFVAEDGASPITIQEQIKEYIQRQKYGKYVVIKDPVFIPVSTTIEITTDSGISNQMIDAIKSKVAKIYDGVKLKFNESSVYFDAFNILKESVIGFSIKVTVSDTGAYKNRNFYTLAKSDVTVNVISTGY